MLQAIEQETISIVSPKTGACWLFEGKSRHTIKWESVGVTRVRIFLELYEKEDDADFFMSWMVTKSIVGVAAISQSYSVVLAEIERRSPIIAHPFYKIRVLDVDGIAPDGVSEFFSIVKEFDGSDM